MRVPKSAEILGVKGWLAQIADPGDAVRAVMGWMIVGVERLTTPDGAEVFALRVADQACKEVRLVYWDRRTKLMATAPLVR